MRRLEEIELFVMDMDGTIYLENQLIEGAKEWITLLQENNRKFVFLTNNSSKSAKDYQDKLDRLGIKCELDQIFTSGMAMGMFLNENYPKQSIYLVGTKALEKELKEYGVSFSDSNPQIVVVGYDRELNYEKIEKACAFLDEGATFLATNIDLVYPVAKNKYLPDCASICAMLTNATKKEPLYIGKPSRKMLDLLAGKYKIANDKIAMVGDRIYTDIATAYHAGSLSVLVLSGETKKEDIMFSSIQPDLVFTSVNELKEALKKVISLKKSCTFYQDKV